MTVFLLKKAKALSWLGFFFNYTLRVFYHGSLGYEYKVVLSKLGARDLCTNEILCLLSGDLKAKAMSKYIFFVQIPWARSLALSCCPARVAFFWNDSAGGVAWDEGDKILSTSSGEWQSKMHVRNIYHKQLWKICFGPCICGISTCDRLAAGCFFFKVLLY